MKTVEEIKEVEAHCAVLWQWLDLVVAKAREEGEDADENFKAIAKAETAIRTAVLKSSYLGRRLYGGEDHRPLMCPEHKGRWSGLPHPARPPACGCDLTGWLHTKSVARITTTAECELCDWTETFVHPDGLASVSADAENALRKHLAEEHQ